MFKGQALFYYILNLVSGHKLRLFNPVSFQILSSGFYLCSWRRYPSFSLQKPMLQVN